MDLAEGHLAALNWLNDRPDYYGVEVFNLGTGKGVSVLEIIKSFEQATKQEINYEIVSRRSGDLPAFWANTDKAEKVLNWKAKYSLDEMMIDAWNWQSKNPNGYN